MIWMARNQLVGPRAAGRRLPSHGAARWSIGARCLRAPPSANHSVCAHRVHSPTHVHSPAGSLMADQHSRGVSLRRWPCALPPPWAPARCSTWAASGSRRGTCRRLWWPRWGELWCCSAFRSLQRQLRQQQQQTGGHGGAAGGRCRLSAAAVCCCCVLLCLLQLLLQPKQGSLPARAQQAAVSSRRRRRRRQGWPPPPAASGAASRPACRAGAALVLTPFVQPSLPARLQGRRRRFRFHPPHVHPSQLLRPGVPAAPAVPAAPRPRPRESVRGQGAAPRLGAAPWAGPGLALGDRHSPAGPPARLRVCLLPAGSHPTLHSLPFHAACRSGPPPPPPLLLTPAIPSAAAPSFNTPPCRCRCP